MLIVFAITYFQLLVSIMFVLLEWSMRLPVDMLLDTSGGRKSLMYKAFRVRSQKIHK